MRPTKHNLPTDTRPTYLRVGREDAPVATQSFDRMPHAMSGYVIKGSKRWLPGPHKPVEYKFPFIEKKGHISGCSQATVKCEPQQFVASVVATVANRLRKHSHKFNKYGVVIRAHRLLVRAAYYYTVSKNDWFLDRVVALCRDLETGRSHIAALLTKFLTRVDDYNRFVYSHVLFQAKWLFTRAARPRDKSRFNFFVSEARGLDPRFKNKEWCRRACRETSYKVQSMSPSFDTWAVSLVCGRPRTVRFTHLGRLLLNLCKINSETAGVV